MEPLLPPSSTDPAPTAPPPDGPPRTITIADLLVRITPRAWVTPTLVALIAAGFAIEVYLGASPTGPTGAQLYAAGGDFGPAVAEGEWWRVVTCMFVHAGLLHIAFNLWAFWSIGKFAERVFGNLPYLFIYFLSGVGGSLASLTVHPMTVGVGASGAIFGVYGAVLAFVLLHKGVLPVEFLSRQRNSLLAFIGYNVVFSLSQQNIDMSAHGGGLVAGLFAGAFLSRDLLAPREHVLRRVGAALALGAMMGATGVAVHRRLADLPVVRADRAARQGLTLLQAEDLTGAITAYTEALAYQQDAAWLSNRGLAYMMKGDYPRAKADFRESLFKEPTPRTRALLCEIEARRGIAGGEVDDALRICGEAVTAATQDADPLAFRASIEADHDRLDQALTDANAALALDEEQVFARSVRVDVRIKQEKAAEAEGDCQRLLATAHPRSFDEIQCARVAYARKDPGAERVRLDAGLASAPTYPTALFMRGALNDAEGRWEESLRDYRALVEVEPSAAVGWNNLAWVEVATGDFASARGHADRAVALDPDSGSNRGTLCFALAGLGLEKEARAACFRALELTPDSVVDRGMLAFLDRRPADARKAWTEASADPGRARELAPWLAKLPR